MTIVRFRRRRHPAPRRVALYSHDTMGLGHTRRNLLVAQAMTEAFPGLSVLLIAGAGAAAAFGAPPGVDCLTLPALQKDGAGRYRPRSLALPLDELVALRAGTILAALEAFEPDLFVADKEPRGALGELDPALRYLGQRASTRCVLGLRDVLDDPAAVRREWRRAGNHAAIAERYDAVWVYGDRRVCDPVSEYGFPAATAAKLRYAGYLDQRRRLGGGRPSRGEDPLARLGLPPGRLALCLVGGGQDGARLAETFARAELPSGMNGLILSGPYMPAAARERLRRAAGRRPRLRVLEFEPEPTELVRWADRVVAMGGYNTVLELLSFGRPSLIVPRVRPRSEQLIRAERLSALGLLDVLRPTEATPSALSAWLASDRPPPDVRAKVDLNGLERLPGLVAELLSGPLRRGGTAAKEALRYAPS